MRSIETTKKWNWTSLKSSNFVSLRYMFISFLFIVPMNRSGSIRLAMRWENCYDLKENDLSPLQITHMAKYIYLNVNSNRHKFQKWKKGEFIRFQSKARPRCCSQYKLLRNFARNRLYSLWKASSHILPTKFKSNNKKPMRLTDRASKADNKGAKINMR